MKLRPAISVFFLALLHKTNAQAPGNNLFMKYYAGKNFDQRSFFVDQSFFSTDLSKSFVFHSSYYLHDVLASMDVTNPPAFLKENMCLLTTSFVNDDKLCLEGNMSSLSEQKLRGTGRFRIEKGKWSLNGNAGVYLYQQNSNIDVNKNNFLDIQKNKLLNGKANLSLYRYWNNGNFFAAMDGFGYSGKNYFGITPVNNSFSPSFKTDDPDEIFNLRQNRKLYGGRFRFALNTYNSRSHLDVLSYVKHYEDSTRNGWQNYSAKQDVSYTVVQHLYKARFMNYIGGISLLYDRASEKLNGTAIERNLIVPGIYSSYEFSRREEFKVNAQYALDFHPLLGKVFQPSVRADFRAWWRLNFGFFYNRGQRMVNLLQEHMQLIAGNRTVFVPLDPLQESFHKTGAAAEVFLKQNTRFKFVYHFDYFNKYVFADLGTKANELKFMQLSNSFKKHVFESSFYITSKNGTYLNLKMRNNIFYLFVNGERTNIFYMPKNDFMLQGMINFLNKEGKAGHTKNSIDLQASQYLAAKQRVLVVQESGTAWKNKSFYQLDLDLIMRSEGKSVYDERRKKQVMARGIDLRISWVNVTAFIQKDVFVQTNVQDSFKGLQTWANFNPSRVCLSFTYKFGKAFGLAKP